MSESRVRPCVCQWRLVISTGFGRHSQSSAHTHAAGHTAHLQAAWRRSLLIVAGRSRGTTFEAQCSGTLSLAELELERVGDAGEERRRTTMDLPTKMASPRPVSLGFISSLLSATAALQRGDEPLPKYGYPSPGALHPVQVYILAGSGVVASDVAPDTNPGGAAPGAGAGAAAASTAKTATTTAAASDTTCDGPVSAYYDPTRHSLWHLREGSSDAAPRASDKALEAVVSLLGTLATEPPTPAEGADTEGTRDAGAATDVRRFYVVLLAHLPAIEPVYGERGLPLAYVEAGAITQALASRAETTGIDLACLELPEASLQTAILKALRLAPATSPGSPETDRVLRVLSVVVR